MREDDGELRLVRRACSRLHLDQIRPHSLVPHSPPDAHADCPNWKRMKTGEKVVASTCLDRSMNAPVTWHVSSQQTDSQAGSSPITRTQWRAPEPPRDDKANPGTEPPPKLKAHHFGRGRSSSRFSIYPQTPSPLYRKWSAWRSRNKRGKTPGPVSSGWINRPRGSALGDCIPQRAAATIKCQKETWPKRTGNEVAERLADQLQGPSFSC